MSGEVKTNYAWIYRFSYLAIVRGEQVNASTLISVNLLFWITGER